MSPEPEPVREVFVGNIAVPIGETIGLRIICSHEPGRGGPEFTTVTVNVPIGSDPLEVLDAALNAVQGGLFTDASGNSVGGAVQVCGIHSVYIGGFDNPNFEM